MTIFTTFLDILDDFLIEHSSKLAGVEPVLGDMHRVFDKPPSIFYLNSRPTNSRPSHEPFLW